MATRYTVVHQLIMKRTDVGAACSKRLLVGIDAQCLLHEWIFNLTYAIASSYIQTTPVISIPNIWIYLL